MAQPDKYEILAELARRRGFFWPSFEIYGGVSGFLDYGPLGISLRRKIERKWRRFFIENENLVEIDTPIIVPEKVFEASGHVEHFKDPIVQCAVCGRAFRADQLLEEKMGTRSEGLSIEEIDEGLKRALVMCPECGGALSATGQMSTMFRTSIGPLGEAVAYGRPETAQGIFVDFRRVHEISRGRLPLGIAQVGRGLRNEVSPRQGPIRLREFNMMEFEFFFDPNDPQCSGFERVKGQELNLVPLSRREEGLEEAISLSAEMAVKEGYVKSDWSAYFMVLSKQFVSELGIPHDRQRFHEKLPQERAHYSCQTYDHEVLLDRWGWVELAGHAHRGDFDLRAHMNASGVDLRVFKPYESSRVVETRRVKPNTDLIQRDFGDDAARLIKLLSDLDPDVFESTVKSKGYIELGEQRICGEHATVVREEREETGEHFIPHVVEPSFGADRLLYATMEYAHTIRDDRVVLRIPRDIAPIDVVVLPLMRKDGLRERAYEIYHSLQGQNLDVSYDEAGSVGRRYARADEAGIPTAVTIDYQTLENSTVTVRDRDSWKQVRVNCANLGGLIKDFLKGFKEFQELGELAK